MVKFSELQSGSRAVAVIGLGYVGLPLAVALGGKFRVIGFDISEQRVSELKSGRDHTREVDPQVLAAGRLEFTSDAARLREAGVIIVAVPTPIDAHNNPDLGPIRAASALVGRNLSRDTVVVYESTVYPGVTEEVCVPALTKESGLELGRDFTVGYSPERINPGDKVHTLESVVKVVAGSDQDTAELLQKLYGSVVRAGIHTASSIKVAEAAKVIENTQRDLNIALMNELSMIFDRLGIDTLEVLEAAGTKWNFLKFYPGLVGGHCIGVDPYYLTYKAQDVGYNPQVILAGRRVNDGMGKYVAQSLVKQMIRSGCMIKGARVLVLGLTFKENVPDLRNTKVVDIISELQDYGVDVLVHDPEADPAEARREYGLDFCCLDALEISKREGTESGCRELSDIDAVVLAVAHDEYKKLSPARLRKYFRLGQPMLCVDIKGIWNPAEAAAEGYVYWRL